MPTNTLAGMLIAAYVIYSITHAAPEGSGSQLAYLMRVIGLAGLSNIDGITGDGSAPLVNDDDGDGRLNKTPEDEG